MKKYLFFLYIYWLTFVISKLSEFLGVKKINKTFQFKKGKSMKIFIVLISFFIPSMALSADATVEMLNKLEKETMVFSPSVIKVDVGDTVFWKATDPGHNVAFMMKGGVPDGVDAFKSKIGKDTEYTFTIPGIYAYICVPHKSMGMIGFVIVGNDLSNLESIKSVKFIGKSKKIAEKLISELN